jgi:hypothetical protein
MQLGRQRSRLQRMQFIGTRKRYLHPKDLLDLDQVLLDVVCQRWRVAEVFANKRIITPCEINGDRLCADTYYKVALPWFRGRPSYPLHFHLNEVVHQYCGVVFEHADSSSRNAVSNSSERTIKRLPKPRCASAT